LKSSTEIRQDFLEFFREKGHRIVPSASVIPYDDPTLLFTNAGMNQFKDVFLGTGKRDYTRCADTQKCIRVSGKHNDLEEVGHDGYHHTFFEMLGNWSFGDYYKKDAIGWAWELITEVWKLPKAKIWASVYKDDDEALNDWLSETDIDRGHVIKFGEKDNFWEMGDTGPCGPCSEIHFDFTESGCEASDINSGNPEVMEFWNLVFIQYNRDSEGKLHDLPQRHVDTGLGFERMVRIIQHKDSDYDTDVFQPLIKELVKVTGVEYNSNTPLLRGGDGVGSQSAMNVVADHIRSLAFAIADGAIPSNEGRGYVLRRILRRAARYGRNLGMRKPFIYNLVDALRASFVLEDSYGGERSNPFPELDEKKDFIKEVIKGEEEGFNETLDRGLVFFNEEIDRMVKVLSGVEGRNTRVFSGDVAFKLHDTYGFPIDLTQLMAREKGYEVDINKFDELMNEQKDRARSERSKDISQLNLGSSIDEIQQKLEFQVEYDPYSSLKELKTEIAFLRTEDGNHIAILKNNPFYSESGGQVSDTGFLCMSSDQKLKVIDSKKNYVVLKKENDIPNINLDGTIAWKTSATVSVDIPRRQSIQRNHSATHLVHEALRQVLGPHVKQMGSYLDDKVLRFDFPHFHKMNADEIKSVEEIVNSKVAEAIGVYTEEMSNDKAMTIPNVKKFFGDKYGDMVRVVFIDEKFSVEFCGGTHVKDTSDIGLFKIVKEESISSGVRRIFAKTGMGIIDYINERLTEIDNISNELPEKYYSNFRSQIDKINLALQIADFRNVRTLQELLRLEDFTLTSLLDSKEKFLEERKQLEKQLAKNKVNDAKSKVDEIIAGSLDSNGVKICSGKIDVDNMDELKEVGDLLRNKLVNGVGLIYSLNDEKINIVAVVTDNLIKEKKLSAGKIAGDVAKILGGGGGGKPHLATAGGKDASKIPDALASLPKIVAKYLNDTE